METGPGIQLIDAALIDEIRRNAAHSPRRRLNHNFHASPTDNPHRFLNVLLEGTYVTPHRHSLPPKSESFLVLDGCAAVIVFHDGGQVEHVYVLTADGKPPADLALKSYPVARGVDLPPGVWHTVVALSPAVVCYEVKPGPWEPATDKEFAPWAPREQDAAARDYLKSLVDACVAAA